MESKKPAKRIPEFSKIKAIQPAQRYNIVGVVQSINDSVSITRMDGSKVTLGTAVIADDTARVDMRIKDNQFDIVKKGDCVVLRNARSSVVKGHIMMVVDIWGKVETNTDKTKAIADAKGTKNVSEQEYEAKIEEKTKYRNSEY